MLNDNEPSEKLTLLQSLVKGAKHVICVAWTVPAVQSTVATLLIRYGIPGSLVAIGMAVGEKLAQ